MPELAPVPGTGFQVARSILGEVKRLLQGYPVKITAAYATTGHAPAGDHPKGLALDLVPDTARGGTWADVDALARRAEPTQDHPAAGFRWVGWNGDPGHGDPSHAGQNAHLHLSFIPPEQGGGRGSFLATALAPVSLIGKGIDAGLGASSALLASDAQGPAKSAAEAVPNIAQATASALVDLAAAAIGKDLVRWVLYGALVVAGVLLVIAGAGRTVGLPIGSTIKGAAALKSGSQEA